MIYIYPEKNLRSYPGTIRDTDEWKCPVLLVFNPAAGRILNYFHNFLYICIISLFIVFFNAKFGIPAVRNKFSSFFTSIAFSRFYPVIHFSQINKLCYAHLIAVLVQCFKFVDKYLVVSSSIQPPPVLK